MLIHRPFHAVLLCIGTVLRFWGLDSWHAPQDYENGWDLVLGSGKPGSDLCLRVKVNAFIHWRGIKQWLGMSHEWPILSLFPRVFSYIYINHAVRHSGLLRDMFSIVIVIVIVIIIFIIIIIIIIIMMSLATSAGWSSKYPSTPPPRLCFAPQTHCRIGRHEAVDNAKELLDTLVQANILR